MDSPYAKRYVSIFILNMTYGCLPYFSASTARRASKKGRLPKMATNAPEAELTVAAISNAESDTHSDDTNVPEATIASEPTTPTTDNKKSENVNKSSATRATMAKVPAATVGPPDEIETHPSPQVRDLTSMSRMEDKFEVGYDSDGKLGPFTDMENIEGQQIFD